MKTLLKLLIVAGLSSHAFAEVGWTNAYAFKVSAFTTGKMSLKGGGTKNLTSTGLRTKPSVAGKWFKLNRVFTAYQGTQKSDASKWTCRWITPATALENDSLELAVQAGTVFKLCAGWDGQGAVGDKLAVKNTPPDFWVEMSAAELKILRLK